MEAQVTVADNPDSGFKRGKSKQGGGGNVNSGGYRQKWIPSESSNARAAVVKKGQDAGGKAFVEKNHKKPVVSLSELEESSKAWSKVHNIDIKPNKSESTTADSSSTSSARGSSSRKTVEQSFVAYLPQDDVVLEASETQGVIDLLNKQLSSLLRLPYRRFWDKVTLDESLSVFLDSYLHYRKRWFDVPTEPPSRPEINIVVGDGDLSRRVFMVLLRLSSRSEPGVADSESLSAKEHAGFLKERKLFDIPKLLDVSAIYGQDNPALTQRLVRNVFEAQPEYIHDLAGYVSPILERIITLHQYCCETVDNVAARQLNTDTRKDLTGPEDPMIFPVADRVFEELLEIVDYLNDFIFTLSAFILVFPSAATILITSGYSNSGSEQGLFLCAFASMHDILLPKLLEGFQLIVSNLSKKNEQEAAFGCPIRLERMRKRLVDLGWLLIEARYFRDSSGEDMSATPSQYDPDEVIIKGDSLVQELVALAIGPSDYSSNSGFACTGSLLKSMEKSHGLSYHLDQACQRGALVLDDAQKEYISALLVDERAPVAPVNLTPGTKQENVLRLTYPEKGADDETVIRQSKISQIRDIFPDFGEGFIDACLEAYDNNSENVIQRILEGTLHPELKELETSLAAKPASVAKPQPVKDKGKGKMHEITEAESFWEDKPPLPPAGGSSAFPTGGSSSSSSAASRGESPLSNVTVREENTGRYMRRQKEDDENFSDLLDSRRTGQEDLQRAIKAAAARAEYEDEYDDSFDELGYMADAGGIEETETLADLVGKRGGGRRDNPESGSSGRPSPVTPWGVTSSSGNKKSSGNGPSGRGDSSSRGERQHPAGGPSGKLEHQRGDKAESELLAGGFKDHHEPSRGDRRQSANALKSIEETQGRENTRRNARGAACVNLEAQRGQPADGQVKELEAQKGDKLGFEGSSNALSTSQGSHFGSPVSEMEGQQDGTQGNLAAGRGRGGRGGRGRGKNRGPQPKSEFYLKDGKLYSYKVAGAVAVGSVEEADAIKQEMREMIYGLGEGGNVPRPQDGNEGRHEDSGNAGRGERGRGRGGYGRGRGDGRGRGGYDNHHRKDKAMQKLFSGLGS
ncbi:hypothetical protein R1flu_024890 [Riccia fluitans]|uniref:CUE domain-containing protein n=1 Tax=Riccia fluitans TaxID=41844 RepID=A0ABD1Y093_9MARC